MVNDDSMINNNLVGGWPTPLKNDGVRQLGWLFPRYGNINVPNHQPDNDDMKNLMISMT
jgi:hypothetical protein